MKTAQLCLIVALLACPAAAQPAPADAVDPGAPGGAVQPARPLRAAPARPGAAVRAERLARILQLTPDQRRQLAEIRRTTREEVRARLDHARTLRAELREELDAPQPDAQRVGATVIELRATRQELATTRRAVLQRLAGILDERQRQALAALREARQARPR